MPLPRTVGFRSGHAAAEALDYLLGYRVHFFSAWECLLEKILWMYLP